MTEQPTDPQTDGANTEAAKVEMATRRAVFRKSAEIAVTAPAIALLLSATAKKAHAASPYQNDAGQANSSTDPSDLPVGGQAPYDDYVDDGTYNTNYDRAG